MDAKAVLSRTVIGLRRILMGLSILSTAVTGSTCLLFMLVALMFCDTCSGIGDWVKGAALPLGAMGLVIAASTVIGLVLYARRRWALGSICLVVAPGLILSGGASPTIREAVPVLAAAGFPLQIYLDARHASEVRKAGEFLIAQAGSVIAGADGPLKEGWHRTDTGQVMVKGLPWELCNAAAYSASSQHSTLRAQCSPERESNYTLTIEEHIPLKRN